jgi:type IV fimbrial biogenesis protein FimT
MTKQAGITVAELMLVLAIVALISLVAVPGFSSLLLGTRMNNSVNELFHSLHSARQNAMLSGVTTVICGSKNFRQCSSDGDWSDGWLIFANTDADVPPRVSPGDRILHTARNPAGLRISANRANFAMAPFGLRSTNGTLIWCDRRGSAHARALIVSYTGKPRLSTTMDSGNPLRCPEENGGGY